MPAAVFLLAASEQKIPPDFNFIPICRKRSLADNLCAKLCQSTLFYLRKPSVQLLTDNSIKKRISEELQPFVVARTVFFFSDMKRAVRQRIPKKRLVPEMILYFLFKLLYSAAIHASKSPPALLRNSG